MTNERFFRKLSSLFVDARNKLSAAKDAGRIEEVQHWVAIMVELQIAINFEPLFRLEDKA